MNPAHLAIVTQGENNRRIGWDYRSRIKKCPKGHDLEVHGRRTPEAGMVCRVCSGTWDKPAPEPELE